MKDPISLLEMMELGGPHDAGVTCVSAFSRVHKIYEETVWRDSAGGQGFSGMGFIIKKIVVHRKPTPVREGRYNAQCIVHCQIEIHT